MRTRKDSKGRTWEYSAAEGSWAHGPHVIGCGGKNGRKWSVWTGPNSGHYEYETLREAMEACS